MSYSDGNERWSIGQITVAEFGGNRKDNRDKVAMVETLHWVIYGEPDRTHASDIGQDEIGGWENGPLEVPYCCGK